MKGSFKIESNISERDLIESCLNYHCSGYDFMLILLFHALAHQWKYDKLIYYRNLILDSEQRSKR